MKKWIVFLQQVGLRDEIGIEDTDEIALGGGEPGLQGARLEAGPVGAVDQLHVEPAALQFVHAGGRQLAGVVGGIVQHLDLQKLARIIELADRFEEPLDDIDFIEDRQLHRHPGQLLEMARRRHGAASGFSGRDR